MSGSPVVAVAHKGFEVEENRFMAVGGHGHRFVGVYSGRVGDLELQAQLGIVWKPQLVWDIIDVPTKGKCSFWIF